MTKIVVNTIRSQTGVTSVTFHDTITANGKKQWLDRFGIIKANSTEIDENVTIPTGTNGLKALQDAWDLENDSYKSKRRAEYPDLVSQLDDIYHNGIDGWKTTNKTIKDKYPVPL